MFHKTYIYILLLRRNEVFFFTIQMMKTAIENYFKLTYAFANNFTLYKENIFLLYRELINLQLRDALLELGLAKQTSSVWNKKNLKLL